MVRYGSDVMHFDARCHCDVCKIVPCQPRAQACIAFRSMATVRPSLRYEPEVATISRRSAAASCTDVQDAPRKDGERVMITQRWHGASSFEAAGRPSCVQIARPHGCWHASSMAEAAAAAAGHRQSSRREQSARKRRPSLGFCGIASPRLFGAFLLEKALLGQNFLRLRRA